MIARRVRFAALLSGALLSAAAAPALLGSISLQGGSRVWVEGSSTVRSWRCESAQPSGTATTAEGLPALDQVVSQVRRAEITIPVASLDCRNGTMNGHMRRALKSEANPAIRFRLNGLQAAQGAGAVRMNGTLSIAGTERPISLDATVAEADNGQLRVRGSKSFPMTEFGVTPPSLMMGTMKVRDPVTVHFDVLLK